MRFKKIVPQKPLLFAEIPQKGNEILSSRAILKVWWAGMELQIKPVYCTPLASALFFEVHALGSGRKNYSAKCALCT